MGATIYDIARLTGYNPGTVSRALNNDPRVKDKTREKICEVERQIVFLDFSKNRMLIPIF